VIGERRAKLTMVTGIVTGLLAVMTAGITVASAPSTGSSHIVAGHIIDETTPAGMYIDEAPPTGLHIDE
jgi:hypothetical protein